MLTVSFMFNNVQPDEIKFRSGFSISVPVSFRRENE
jgi:hypothetical protein